MLQGFRTLLVNIVAIAATWLAVNFGIELNEETQAAIVVTLLAVINIALRCITTTPVGKKE